MGDLKGHMIPGTMFLMFGVWWALCSIRRYLMYQRANKKYVSTATFGFPCACGKLASLPVEGFFKVALASAGTFGEIVSNLPHPSMGIIQHSTMYFFFAMSGIVDISLHYGRALPEGSDYLVMALAVGIEGMLFANHLHGRPPLDVHIHTLLVYVVFMLCFVIILECKFQKTMLLTLTRCFLIILQGTWFWAVGIILYGHDKNSGVWDLNSHDDIMKTTIYFSWHCACILLFLLSLVGLMSGVYRCFHGPATRNGAGPASLSMTSLTSRGENGGGGHANHGEYSILMVRDDDDDDDDDDNGGDSDIEFEKPVEIQKVTSSH